MGGDTFSSKLSVAIYTLKRGVSIENIVNIFNVVVKQTTKFPDCCYRSSWSWKNKVFIPTSKAFEALEKSLSENEKKRFVEVEVVKVVERFRLESRTAQGGFRVKATENTLKKAERWKKKMSEIASKRKMEKKMKKEKLKQKELESWIENEKNIRINEEEENIRKGLDPIEAENKNNEEIRNSFPKKEQKPFQQIISCNQQQNKIPKKKKKPIQEEEEEKKDEEDDSELEILKKRLKLLEEQNKLIKKISKKKTKKRTGKLYAFICGQNGGTPRLFFPWSDCKLMSVKLKKLGYDCTEVYFKENEQNSNHKLTNNVFRASFIKFTNQLKEGDQVVFYYAGHGHQQNGKNYLVCVKDGNLNVEDMKLSFLIKKLRKKKTINIFLLDCCQHDPSDKTWKDEIRRGNDDVYLPPSTNPISNIQVQGGQFIFGFACEPGVSTVEKRGGGVYTKSLLKFIDEDEDVYRILTKTNKDLFQNEKRRGFISSNALDELYL